MSKLGIVLICIAVFVLCFWLGSRHTIKNAGDAMSQVKAIMDEFRTDI